MPAAAVPQLPNDETVDIFVTAPLLQLTARPTARMTARTTTAIVRRATSSSTSSSIASSIRRQESSSSSTRPSTRHSALPSAVGIVDDMPAAASASPATATSSSVDSGADLSVGAIAGIAVGGAIVLVLLVGLVACLLRRRSTQRQQQRADSPSTPPVRHNDMAEPASFPKKPGPVKGKRSLSQDTAATAFSYSAQQLPVYKQMASVHGSSPYVATSPFALAAGTAAVGTTFRRRSSGNSEPDHGYGDGPHYHDIDYSQHSQPAYPAYQWQSTPPPDFYAASNISPVHNRSRAVSPLAVSGARHVHEDLASPISDVDDFSASDLDDDVEYGEAALAIAPPVAPGSTQRQRASLVDMPSSAGSSPRGSGSGVSGAAAAALRSGRLSSTSGTSGKLAQTLSQALSQMPSKTSPPSSNGSGTASPSDAAPSPASPSKMHWARRSWPPRPRAEQAEPADAPQYPHYLQTPAPAYTPYSQLAARRPPEADSPPGTAL